MKKILSFLLISPLLLILASFQFIPSAYASPDTLAYYPSNYNLLGSTSYISGSLTDLQLNDSIYMTFRSYGYSTSTLYPVANMNFTSSSNGWSTVANVTAGIASYGYDDSSGNTLGSGPGSYHHKAEPETYYSNILSNGNFTNDASGWNYGEASDENGWASGAWSSTGGRTDEGCYLITVTDNSATILDTTIEAWIDYQLTINSVPSSAIVKAAYNLTTSGKGESIIIKIKLIRPDSSVTDVYASPTYTSTIGSYVFVSVNVTQYILSTGTYILRLYHTQDTGDRAADKITTKIYWDDIAFSIFQLQPANITFTSETSFNYDYSAPISASLSYAYSVSGDSIGNGSSITIKLIKPDNTTIELDNVNLPTSQISWTYKSGIAINTTFFAQSGTYHLQVISKLISNNSGTYIQLNFDNIGIKLTYYSEYAVEVELSGGSNNYNWTQITWTVDSAWTEENVTVTLQLFNFTSGQYPTSGNGYISYTSSSTSNTEETKSQTITANPEDFRNASGNWKIKISGIKSTMSKFELKLDFVEFKVEYINMPPVASFTESAETVYTGETITFNASASYDSDGTIVSYFWDFGDGTNATGVAVQHSYSENGTYTVTLTVTDDNGAVGTATATKTVLNRSPIASFTESSETAYTGESITFNASASYDPDGTIVSYYWDFGDGTNATGVVVSHAYSNDGNYTVTLLVTDDDGGVASSSSMKTIINQPPIAAFNYSPIFPIALEDSVTFNASSSFDPDGSIVSYVWDFGDGSFANVTEPILTHTFGTHGQYTVTLIVVDNYGLSNNISRTVTVRGYPTAYFDYSPYPPQQKIPVTFNASLSSANGGYIVSYVWDFGDGNVTATSNPIITHIYNNIGSYDVTLVVVDSEALNSSFSASLLVIGAYPIPIFSVDPQNPIAGETATFNASSSYDPDGYIVSYVWDFGDGTGTTTTFKVAYHTYEAPGIYNVSLTVKDNDGFEKTAVQQVKVVSYPIPSFSYTPETYPKVSEPVIFNASSSLPGSGYITAYVWDFGDGNVTATSNPIITHIYNKTGSYVVTLTVFNSDGLSGNTTRRVDVYGDPVADFTWDPIIPKVGEEVTFNASNSQPNGVFIRSYIWNFGDGTSIVTTSVPIVTHIFSTYGIFNVTLTVENNAGFTGVSIKQLEVISLQLLYSRLNQHNHTSMI